MLALKKKREEQRKAAEEAAKAEAAKAEATASSVSAPTDGAEGGGQVSLFGIGGKKKTKKDDQSGTKKTPGEIRIQKGRVILFHIIGFGDINLYFGHEDLTFSIHSLNPLYHFCLTK